MTRKRKGSGKPQSFKTRRNPEYVKVGSDPVTYTHYRESVSSPVYPGTRKIQVRQNPHVFRRGKLLSSTLSSYWGLDGDIGSSDGPLGGAASEDFSAALPGLENAAGAKFNKKLRTGSASLGVSLASWRQSRDMFTTRITRLSTAVYLRTRKLERDPRRLAALRADIARDRARGREPVANLILEVEFGWRPLYDDLAAASKLATSSFPPTFTRAGKRAVLGGSRKSKQSDYTLVDSFDMVASVTYGALVQLTNPNAYLANKAGLANPLTVAWDLVPWSFVVNMFVNVNAHISSLTDEVGLSITNRALTRTRAVHRTRLVVLPDKYSGSSHTFGREKIRLPVSSTPLHWQVRMPSFSWETALIASSLCVQRIKKLNNLLKI